MYRDSLLNSAQGMGEMTNFLHRGQSLIQKENTSSFQRRYTFALWPVGSSDYYTNEQKISML